MKTQAWLLAVVAFFLLGAVCRAKPPGGDQPPSSNPTRRRAAFDFTVNDLAGTPHTLSAMTGKVVLVDFWATWCPPCRAEMPELVKLHGKYAAQGLVIWGLALDKPEAVKKYVGQHPVPYPVLVGAPEDAVAPYRIEGIPTSILVDKKGRIAYRHVGFAPEMVAQFEQEIETLLAEPAP